MSSRCGPRMVGKRSRERRDDRGRLVDRQRRLRDVGELRVRRERQPGDVLDRLDEHDRLGRLAHRPDDLLVAGVADQHDRVALGGIAARLDVHLRDERARGVDRVQAARGRALEHGRRDAVGREDDRRALGRLVLVLDEDRPAVLEIADDVLVVDDLVPDVDRFVVVLQSELDGLDGALDAGTEAARRRKEDSLDHGRDASRDPRGYEKSPRLGGVGAAGLSQVAHRGLGQVHAPRFASPSDSKVTVGGEVVNRPHGLSFEAGIPLHKAASALPGASRRPRVPHLSSTAGPQCQSRRKRCSSTRRRSSRSRSCTARSRS